MHGIVVGLIIAGIYKLANSFRAGLGCMVFIGLFFMIALALVVDFQSHQNSFKFKISVDLSENGVISSKSSIIESTWRWREPIFGLNGSDKAAGTSVVFNLKEKGWLALPLIRYSVYRTDTCPPDLPQLQDIPLIIYKKDKKKISDTDPELKRIAIDPNHFPPFYWFSGPRKSDLKMVCADEIPRLISPNVKIVRMTIEPAPDADIENNIKDAPPWLVDWRSQHGGTAVHDLER